MLNNFWFTWHVEQLFPRAPVAYQTTHRLSLKWKNFYWSDLKFWALKLAYSSILHILSIYLSIYLYSESFRYGVRVA